MGNKKDRKAPKSLLQKTLGANDANALAPEELVHLDKLAKLKQFKGKIDLDLDINTLRDRNAF
jgi:hypothetical protein